MQTEMKTEVVLCPNCKEEVPKTLYCLNCGYPLYKMQSTPVANDEEKKVEEQVSEPETVESEDKVKEKTEDKVIDDFSIDNVMDEVEDLGMEPESVYLEENVPLEKTPIVSEQETIITAHVEPPNDPEPATIDVEPINEDVIIATEPEIVIDPQPSINEPVILVPEIVATDSKPITKLEDTLLSQPVVVKHIPTPIIEKKSEPEPLVISPEPVYTASREPENEPENLIINPETKADFETVPNIPKPFASSEVENAPIVTIESVVEKINTVEYDPDPAIKELMREFAKNLSMKIRLVDLLKIGEVKKETFHRLFESYLARGDNLMNNRNEILERVKYELESKEKSYNETKIGLEELKIKKAIGDVSEGEFKAKFPGLEWDINKYENEVNHKIAEINYLNDINNVLSEEEINELTQMGKNSLNGLDQLAFSNFLDPEIAGRVKVSIEEAIACLKP